MKKNESDGTTYRDYNSKPIPFSKCEIGKNFHYPDKNEIKDFHIESFYCPNTDKLIIQGNWHAPVFGVVTLKFVRCSHDPREEGYSPNVTCASDTDFNSWFKKTTIQEIIISNYFDSSDYDNPIHYFLDDLWVSLHLGRSVMYQTFIKKNLLKLQDDFFGLFSSIKEDYFYVRSHNEYFTTDDTEGPGKGVYFE